MLTIKDLTKALNASVVTGEDLLERQITDGYCCDLLSWVIGRAPESCAWFTVMTNINVIAVAVMADIPCVVVTEGAEIPQDMITKAQGSEVCMLSTSLNSYEACIALGKLL